MDPNDTWMALLHAYHEGDYAAVEEHSYALLDWMQKGNLPPAVMNGFCDRPDLRGGDKDDYARTVATVFAEHALEKAVENTFWSTNTEPDEEAA